MCSHEDLWDPLDTCAHNHLDGVLFAMVFFVMMKMHGCMTRGHVHMNMCFCLAVESTRPADIPYAASSVL